ncbi:MAG: hypothetical protein WD045_06010 [Pirellulaceae bacterium]
MTECWLQCEVSPGQFSGEFAVRGTDSAGRFFSLFVDSDDMDDDREFLRVKPLAIDRDVVLVELPRATLENGNTVTVNKSQVSDSKRREFA